MIMEPMPRGNLSDLRKWAKKYYETASRWSDLEHLWVSTRCCIALGVVPDSLRDVADLDALTGIISHPRSEKSVFVYSSDDLVAELKKLRTKIIFDHIAARINTDSFLALPPSTSKILDILKMVTKQAPVAV